MRFMPQAVGGLRAGLGQLGRGSRRPAGSLGDGPVRAFARLTLPALRPALVPAGALVFLTVVKELPLALLLAPIGFDTLATEIWDAAVVRVSTRGRAARPRCCWRSRSRRSRSCSAPRSGAR